MPAPSRSDIMDNLNAVRDPVSGRGLADAGMVSGVQVDDAGALTFLITVDAHAHRPHMETLRRAAEEAASSLPGIARVTAILTAEKKEPARETLPAGVRHVIAVASGKGGVGKSTVAVNLAAALAQTGWHMGLLDADIYGPSQPRLTGTKDARPAQDEGGLQAPVAHGVRVMSIGHMVAEDTPMIWRGPMVQSALLQMLRDVDWSGCDALVIDLPPGTGDIHLTLAQKTALSGAVVVSTPQDIALIDARKAIAMFERVAVPILGIVENMSYFCCPACNHRTDIFAHGGAQAEAEKLGVPFLGALPLSQRVRELSDAGTPLAVADPDGEHARAFMAMAVALRDRLESGAQDTRAPPVIGFA